ncbi:quinoprotein relay system zinc metallohydrolase 2 [Thioalkalivibrio sp. HK1]|uniref:quinoprotein relay system zinc metallohydrolase 2 n=1 Tax=Thioalkalivibrio sp. HK1 TaxID=1469245 RepID=UPI000470C389|nr:quinoprotein relay system zinc metallohydrolase 2 [Thioalkalivibrio sp. HK1]
MYILALVRRTLPAIAAGMVLVLFSSLSLPTKAQPAPLAGQSAKPLDLDEIAEGIHVYAGAHDEDATPGNLGGFSNAALVIGKRSIAVIDSGGSRAFGLRLRASARALSDLPIRYVINTHVHPDHIFGNGAFDDAQSVVVGHHKLPRALLARASFYLENFGRRIGARFEGTRAIPPTMTVDRSMRIDLGERELILDAWSTAHTDNDLTVFDPATGTLFAGDLLFVDRLPIIDGSLKGWLQVLTELRSIPARRVVPGHGPAFAPWPNALDAQERYFRALLRDTRAALDAGHRIERAIESVASEERGRWIHFDIGHPRNITAAFTELEWE